MENVYRERKIRKIIIVVGIGILIAGGLFMWKSKEPKVIAANSYFYLTEEEIEDYENKVEQGDAVAAKKLGDYYDMYLYDIENAMRYYKKGADFGNVTCQYNYAYDLLAIKDDSRFDEAIIYLKLAASGGNQYATRRLEKLGIEW